MLLLPPPPHVITLLAAAAKNPIIADTLAEGFNHPNSLFPWIADAAQTQTMIENSQADLVLCKAYNI